LVSSSTKTKLVNFNQIETKLNKNNKYKDQIEYKTLTLIRGTLMDWHVDI